MRTTEQISRVASFLRLNRRQKSILEWKKNKINTQWELQAIATSLKELSDSECLAILNQTFPFDNAHSLHF